MTVWAQRQAINIQGREGGPGRGVWDSGGFYLPSSSVSSREALVTLVAFPVVAGVRGRFGGGHCRRPLSFPGRPEGRPGIGAGIGALLRAGSLRKGPGLWSLRLHGAEQRPEASMGLAFTRGAGKAPQGS